MKSRLRRRFLLGAVGAATSSATGFSNALELAGSCGDASLAAFHPVARSLVGINLALVGGEGPTTGLLEATSALHMGHVRWPGGELTNYWDWRVNHPRGYTPSPKLGTPGVSMRQLSVLAKQGAEPIIILNMLTDTLESQLEMLKVATDAGIPITKIELGNEFYLTNRDYIRAFPTPDVYAQIAARWATAVRKAFPQVQIAAVASSLGDQKARTWNAAVASKRNAFDAVTLHTYVHMMPRARWSDIGPGAVEAPQIQQESLRELSEDQGIAKAVTNYDRSMDYLLHTGMPGVAAFDAIWFTEFNKSHFLSQVNGTWLHGLVVVAFIIDLLTDRRIKLATLYNFCGPSNYAAIYRSRDALYGLLNAPKEVPVNSFSPSGVAIALAARAMNGVREVAAYRDIAKGIHVARAKTDQGERLLAANLSNRDVQLNCSGSDFLGGNFMRLQAMPMRRFAIEGANPLTTAERISVSGPLICPKYSLLCSY